jgi:hypothetical protein
MAGLPMAQAHGRYLFCDHFILHWKFLEMGLQEDMDMFLTKGHGCLLTTYIYFVVMSMS